MAEGAGLAYVDAGEHGAVLHGGTVLDDEVVGDDSVADVYGSFAAAVEGAVLQTSGAFDLRIRAHVHILYVARIDDGAVVAYGSA